jgi:hypothetical protein
MHDNPYAAPVATGPSPWGSLFFSEEGMQIVGSMARWMRFLSTMYFIGAGFMGLAALGALVMAGAMGLFFLVAFGIAIAFMAIVGMWLRDAAGSFLGGVTTDEPMTLGAGFRTLRKYFILLGILEAFNLVGALMSLSNLGAM